MTFTTCANCGSPVTMKKNKPVCKQCGRRRKDQSALAPSPEQIAKAKAELRKCPVSAED